MIAVTAYAVTLLRPPVGWGTAPAPLSPWLVIVGAVSCGSLVFRRHLPRAVLLVTVVGAVVVLVLDRAWGPMLVWPIVAMFSFAVARDRRSAVAAGALTALTLTLAVALFVPGLAWNARTAGLVAWIGMATAIGAAVRSHRQYVDRMMAKLDAHDRAQLVVIAYETGLVSPGAVPP